ncbi:MAG: hypothetical protein IPM99_11750 [Rubrivivax sp.]|nr:hypothetical protein [Rubrivivax sp.]
MPATQDMLVRDFRQALLWPLQLVPQRELGPARPWEHLPADGPWHEVADEFDPATPLEERHYSEFVTFLPYVQRFLYGEARRGGSDDDDGQSVRRGSPMRVFRRRDITAARAVVQPGTPALQLEVEHVDLYFFYDLDLVLLNVEVSGKDIPLALVQELMYRLGRGYPGAWDADGRAQHCLFDLEWLAADGRVLARSDAQQREPFLAFVARHRAPLIAAHWAFVLEPLVPELSPDAGALRYRQIEYHRMPTMAYLALDDPRRLSRADFVRLGLVTGAGRDHATPYAEDPLRDFEQRHCYDRFWSDAGAAPHTRYMGNGHALVVVGDAQREFFRCAERGVLAQFRHQHFLLFLIAHVQKAALLMFSDRLVDALERLDVGDADSVKRFKRTIRRSFESFLRFTHRYWFHEISEQAQVRALFRLTARHLELDALYAEVKDRTADMNTYLDADSLRRQANTVVRLTVVTIFGLIGTITTGFLGINLIAEAEQPLLRRLLIFGAVAVATIALTVFTVVRSKRLSDFLDALSDERLPAWRKAASLLAVFSRDRR